MPSPTRTLVSPGGIGAEPIHRRAFGGRDEPQLFQACLDGAHGAAVLRGDLRRALPRLKRVDELRVLVRAPRSTDVPGKLRTTRRARDFLLHRGDAREQRAQDIRILEHSANGQFLAAEWIEALDEGLKNLS